jgi:hypothetical protein
MSMPPPSSTLEVACVISIDIPESIGSPVIHSQFRFGADALEPPSTPFMLKMGSNVTGETSSAPRDISKVR